MTWKNSDKPTLYSYIPKKFLFLPFGLIIFGIISLCFNFEPLFTIMSFGFGFIGLFVVPYNIYSWSSKEWKVGLAQNWKCFDCGRDISNEDNWHCNDNVFCCVNCGKKRWGRIKDVS